MDSGYGLGKAGAFNAFLRMGFHPELIAPDALRDPNPGDLLVICESGRLSAEDIQTIRKWSSVGGGVLASGASESWSELLPGVTLDTHRVANPYAGLAVVLDGGAPELIAPPRWRHFSAVTAPGSKYVYEFAGQLAEVSGERQTPARALVSAVPNSPALIRRGRLCLVNADPFSAFQSWLQGQEDLQPWLNWRHRLFWLDEYVACIRSILLRGGVLTGHEQAPGIVGLGETTVVLRHDLDHSRDTSYLDLERERSLPAVHAVLKDANTNYWNAILRKHPSHESAFHYNSARYSRAQNWLRTRVLGLPALPYLPSRSEIAGKGLLQQVRWAKRRGVGIASRHRHLSLIYYPEFIDALDEVFRNESEVLGGSSFYRGQILRWGVDRADGIRGTYAGSPDVLFPYWFPFRLAHAGESGRLLRGWETASLMEAEPELVEQMLDHRIGGIPHRILTLTYHPAHAQRPTFADGGSIVWFRRVLELLAKRGIPVLTLGAVFKQVNLSLNSKLNSGV